MWQVLDQYFMRPVSTVRERLVERNGIVFLIAGGMLFVATANDALGAYTPLTTQAGIPLAVEAVAGFGGLVLAIVGLLGLYPQLSDRSPRLAQIGVALVALPAVVFAVLLTCAIPAGVLGIPSPADAIPALDTIVIAGFLMAAIGAMFFGIAALRERTLSHVLGGSLLLVGVAWFVLFGAAYLNGFPIGHRVLLATGVVQTPALFGTGYSLHLDPEVANRPRVLVDRSVED